MCLILVLVFSICPRVVFAGAGGVKELFLTVSAGGNNVRRRPCHVSTRRIWTRASLVAIVAGDKALRPVFVLPSPVTDGALLVRRHAGSPGTSTVSQNVGTVSSVFKGLRSFGGSDGGNGGGTPRATQPYAPSGPTFLGDDTSPLRHRRRCSRRIVLDRQGTWMPRPRARMHAGNGNPVPPDVSLCVLAGACCAASRVRVHSGGAARPLLQSILLTGAPTLQPLPGTLGQCGATGGARR